MFITREKIEKGAKFQVVICFVLAFIINFTIETCGRGGVGNAIAYLFKQPLIFFYNYLLILVTLSFVLLIRRRMFGWCVVSVIWLALGIANGIILGVRVTPFTAADLLEANAGLAVMDKYLNSFQMALLFGCIGLAGVVFILAFIFAPKYKNKIRYGRNVVCIGTFVALFLVLTKFSLSEGILTRHFGNINLAYQDYGVPYCFTVSLLDSGIKEPADYTEENVLNVLNNTLPDAKSPIVATKNAKTKHPNIIFVQLESFFDITKVKGLTFSEDPIPNYHKLMQKYSSGYVDVPVVGAGTCNTEFEMITGMNLDFFGPGEYPYKTALTDKTSESAAYDLKEIGYGTHAIHDNTATFYGRNKVYPNLGFDTFTSIEYMNNIEKNPNGWAKDKVLTKEIIDSLKSTSTPDYVYTVSVQGHGSYPSEKIDDTQTITISGIEDEAKKNQFEYYTNQIHEMDQFVGELVDQLSALDENTVLVLYGDHLPSLGFKPEDLENNSIYQTEYVIWDNFGMKKQDMNLEAYQMAAAVLGRVGIDNGTLIKYHQNNMGATDYVKDQQMLMYDILYGKKYAYNQQDLYKTLPMTMGVREIRISDIYNSDDTTVVKGENFTPYSSVYINGEYVDTTFVDEHTLNIASDELSDGDKVTVNQIRKDKNILSTSEEFTYQSVK
ncbi:LTA synthase family protein [Anaeromicropila herbilytica]|uniref:Phosphoglycerol transferase n=1 Tax=Anaeromicropila herbilytica TaxID=2785025 RepID=A0A7R7IE20_9FIRM|nr:LTA synthase family protein [Anaeromicropila herbilytica]BCN32167.1 phosphoglycerol transferase [Anaeromicropila herbilytica]